MKPPQRRRAAPARYLGEVTGPAAWSPREKRQLLRLLQARQGQPEPDATELARELPGRSEAEVWMDLAEKITGPLEEALTVAFSQVLTIAATEPVSLLHSKPPKPTQACGKQLLLSAPGGREDSSPETPETPGPAPKTSDPAPKAPSESLADPAAEGDLSVDFEKIYKYLSAISRSCQGPELSAAESAVVLDLLLALPEELPRLPCAALVKHMSDTYLRLTAPQPDPAGEGLGPRAENGGTSPRGPEEASQAMPQAPENAGPSEPRSAWQAAGVCPLNPFLVPLEFLGQAATAAR
ncbi:snRNA-activating protein complex subunit 2 isoform X2 [Prionailurus bengalensis]|uniref:snRNA-activating protein complex subunit 2 isoform X2 n=1 Tax=Prionailurus bengalensis TaxID=37029 RepID=UPI001CAA0395|nr:snRNA-activating protein complex subunit 2 isoform X2 [Prionailurus bengalensis]